MYREYCNATSFYQEAVASGHIWTVFKDEGVPTFGNADGSSTFFVWSSRERVLRTIEYEELFQGCRPLEIPWSIFGLKWLPDLVDRHIMFSLNWKGNDNPVWEESAEEFGINMENKLKE